MPTSPNAIAQAWYAEQVPRLGQLCFANSLPVVLPIEKGEVTLDAEVVYGTPAELNARYASGTLDVGAMSSFFYLTRSDLTLMPGLSIACQGAVGSVLFFSNVAPHRLSGARVAVPGQSATSVHLLKIMLLERLGIVCEYVTVPEPDLEDPQFQAALVFGDRALRVDGDWSNRYWRADLGQWWVNYSGLPMVFGVWAARSNWAARHAEKFEALSLALSSARDRGLTTLLPAVVAEAQKRTGLAAHRLNRYFLQELCFQLTPEHIEGLNCFKKLCQDYRLLA